jgi:hypothetical protein
MMRGRWTISLFLMVFGVTAWADPPKLDTIRNVCGAIEAGLNPIQPPVEFSQLSFELLAPDGASVNVTVSAIVGGGDVEAAKLLLPAGLVIEKGYFVVMKKGTAILDIKPVPVTSDILLFDVRRRSEFGVTFLCDVDPNTVKVEVKRDGNAVSGLTEKILEGSSASVMTLRLNKTLRHEDAVTVTATAQSGAVTTVEGEVDFAAPADIDAATIHVGGAVKVSEGSKPVVLVDLKYDGIKRPIGNSIRWNSGPSLLVDAQTQDSDGEGKATIGYGFRYLDYIGSPKFGDAMRFVLTRLDIVPEFEADDGLNTRNVLLDTRQQWQFAGSKWNARPAIGIELGTNLAQKTKLEEFSGYSMLRPTFDFFLARKFKGVGMFKEISFSIDTQSRYLLDEEPDVEPLPRAEQTADTKTKTVANDGFKFYGKASLTFGLTENFGIAFEYETGEQPPLYGENNKGSVSIVYAF